MNFPYFPTGHKVIMRGFIASYIAFHGDDRLRNANLIHKRKVPSYDLHLAEIKRLA